MQKARPSSFIPNYFWLQRGCDGWSLDCEMESAYWGWISDKIENASISYGLVSSLFCHFSPGPTPRLCLQKGEVKFVTFKPLLFWVFYHLQPNLIQTDRVDSRENERPTHEDQTIASILKEFNCKLELRNGSLVGGLVRIGGDFF